MNCRFVCVLNTLLVFLSPWNTLNLKPMIFFLFGNSFYLVLQRVQQIALVECSQLLLRSKHFCLSFQSQSGEWSWWSGTRFRETLNSNIFHMQEWLGRCRLTIFIKMYSHMKICSNVILCEAMISCQHPAPDHSTLLLCAGSSSLCCFRHLFSKKHPFLPCKREADPFLCCRPLLLFFGAGHGMSINQSYVLGRLKVWNLSRAKIEALSLENRTY